jgi:hypothetical protein
MITFKHSGNFDKTNKFFRRVISNNYMSILEKYAIQGVNVLSSATPVDSGETARSWAYVITKNKTGVKITWTNSHIVDGVPIAVILQYGHGTRDGGYVQGRDYINPALRPIFDKLSKELYEEVTSK